MLFPSVNLFAVLVAAVANMAIGFVWYSPAFLGKPWARLMGFTEKSLKAIQASMGPWYGLSFLAAIVQGSIISVILKMTYVQSTGSALVLGGLCWLGFIAITQFTGTIFDNKKFNPHLLAINTGYQLVSILVMTIIIFAMR